ncbi:MAG: UDP-glucose 4-epimerase GalE, partial [Actinobacteria bacterium]|nr:UDP-glucose 4-epimerase GalE [Actinomycetota bacterium]
AAGHDVVVLDDLSTGRESVVPAGVTLERADVSDREAVEGALRAHAIDGVVHLAAKKAVGESVERPLHYYRQNVDGLLALLEAMDACDVRQLVYSSSASVYGTPLENPVDEAAALRPESPYGQTKVIGEWLMADAAVAHGLSFTSLRYFNVVGAGSVDIGDFGAFNLVPLALRAITSGQAPRIFGDDYPTPDGTCIRDYVHVVDLAEAHAVAVAHCAGTQAASVFNVGRGVGSSVRDVLSVVAEVTGSAVEPVVVARRKGDPAEVVARVDHIENVLGFTAGRDLVEMVESAWAAWPER